MVFKQSPSPNFSKRTTKIDMVVIHNISLPPNEFGGRYIEDFFQNQLDPTAHPYFATIEHLKVSSHLLIKRNGAVVQFVQFADKAWHAGVSHYRGRDNCNDFSIGIELEGTDDIAYTINLIFFANASMLIYFAPIKCTPWVGFSVWGNVVVSNKVFYGILFAQIR
jgi:AmpD protein